VTTSTRPTDVTFEVEKGLSPLAWLGIGTGVAFAVGMLGWIATREQKQETTPDSALSRPRFSSFATSAADELRSALDESDAAYQRLFAAEAALEPISAEFMKLEWEDTDRLLPTLRAAQAAVKQAHLAVAAANRKVRDWSDVIQADRRPAQTEAGRKAQQLLGELEDITNPPRRN